MGVQQAVTMTEVFPPAALTQEEGNTGERRIEPPVSSTSEFKQKENKMSAFPKTCF